MNKNKKLLSELLISFTFFAFFLLTPTLAHASIVDDIKNLFASNNQTNNAFNLNSKIELIDDLNKNGQIDGGDSIRFYYTINNPTDKEYSFLTLKTNIPRRYLNFIHDIHGTLSLSDKKGAITIPNLSVNPGQKLNVSFQARVNYFEDADKTISTEPELLSSDAKSLFKSSKKDLKAKKFSGFNFPSNLKIKNK